MKRLITAGVIAALLPVGACKPSAAVTVDPLPAEAPVVRVEPKVEAEPMPETLVSTSLPASVYEDIGTKLVARTLAPPETAKVPMGRRTKPLPWHGLASLENPTPPLATPLTALIDLPKSKSRSPRPRMLADLIPLADYTAEPTPPQRLDVPPPKLVRTPSRDVNLPIDLPSQANWKPDRASLDDPAAEFALESAQAVPSPLRDVPAPFVPVNLPDPFPNRANITSTAPEPSVVAPTPQVPK